MEFLNEEGKSKYQTMIGSFQWIISIGRFDIQVHVMTLLSFRAMPCRGHLERAKRIYCYIAKMKRAAIRIRTDMPDLTDLPKLTYDWSTSVYGELKEVLPDNTPPPLGKAVTTITYKDANLMHDVLSGHSVTGIVHYMNQTPVDWYTKKQGTVETATYGSEFNAARTAVEQIIDLRTTLRYFGVPVLDHSYMFGDNQSVVTSSTIPQSCLNKRHTILSYHKV